MTLTITTVLDKKTNKNGEPCRIGFTAEYYDSTTDIHHKGQCVYTSLESAFKRWDTINDDNPLTIEL